MRHDSCCPFTAFTMMLCAQRGYHFGWAVVWLCIVLVFLNFMSVFLVGLESYWWDRILCCFRVGSIIHCFYSIQWLLSLSSLSVGCLTLVVWYDVNYRLFPLLYLLYLLLPIWVPHESGRDKRNIIVMIFFFLRKGVVHYCYNIIREWMWNVKWIIYHLVCIICQASGHYKIASSKLRTYTLPVVANSTAHREQKDVFSSDPCQYPTP